MKVFRIVLLLGWLALGFSNFLQDNLIKIENRHGQCAKIIKVLGPVIKNSVPKQTGYHEVIFADFTLRHEVSGCAEILIDQGQIVMNAFVNYRKFESMKSLPKAPDFMILFLDNQNQDDFTNVLCFLKTTALDFSMKVVVVSMFDSIEAFNKIRNSFINQLSAQISRSGYFNVLYINSVDGQPVQKLKKVSIREGFVTISNDDLTFPMGRDASIRKKSIRVAQWDQLPYNYVDDGKVCGVSGKILDIFHQKYNWTYQIVNPQTKHYNHNKFLSLFSKADLVMYSMMRFGRAGGLDNIELNEITGICLLVPNNIPVSSYDNLSFPFEFIILALYVIAVVMLVVVWKSIAAIGRSKFSIRFIIFNTFKLLIGMSFDNEDRMSRKEKLLLYSFTFGNMFFLILYQTWIISLMLSEPSMRSIESLKELNESNTKISNLMEGFDVKFRDKLIVDKVSLNKSNVVFTLPDNFDEDVAYAVSCDYAEVFVKSAKNLKGGTKIYNKLSEPIRSVVASYPVSSMFTMKDEFKLMLQGLAESGIKDKWIRDMTDAETSKIASASVEKTFLSLGDMKVPFFVWAFGMLLGAVVAIIEVIVAKIKEILMRQAMAIITIKV